MRGALALGGGSRLSELSPYFIERLHEHPAGPGRGALAGAGDEQPDLREYWRVVRRHLALIATIALGVVTVVGVAVFVATPIYTASAVILIEPQPPQVLDMKQLMVESSNSAEHDYYKTQYSLLQSESLAAQVIKSLGLQRSPVFNDSNRPRGLIANYWSGLKAWVNGLSGSAGAARRPCACSPGATITRPHGRAATVPGARVPQAQAGRTSAGPG